MYVQSLFCNRMKISIRDAGVISKQISANNDYALDLMRSSRAKLAHTPAATPSCPIDTCSGPGISPALCASSAVSSKARIRTIV